MDSRLVARRSGDRGFYRRELSLFVGAYVAAVQHVFGVRIVGGKFG